MTCPAPQRSTLDCGSFSQADLLRVLRNHLEPKEARFLRALTALRTTFNAEIAAVWRRDIYKPASKAPKSGSCGFSMSAVRHAVRKLELPVPIASVYALPRPATGTETVMPYHYWTAVGREGQRVVIDGAPPTGESKLVIETEEDFLARSAFVPYRRGDQPATSIHELTLNALEALPPQDDLPLPAGISAAACVRYLRLMTSLTDETTG